MEKRFGFQFLEKSNSGSEPARVSEFFAQATQGCGGDRGRGPAAQWLRAASSALQAAPLRQCFGCRESGGRESDQLIDRRAGDAVAVVCAASALSSACAAIRLRTVFLEIDRLRQPCAAGREHSEERISFRPRIKFGEKSRIDGARHASGVHAVESLVDTVDPTDIGGGGPAAATSESE